MGKIKLSTILPNPENPRTIGEEQLQKLVESIKAFPQMLELRPMVIDEKRILLGGNMRHKALEILGYTEIPEEWLKYAKDLTLEQKKEFIVKDNVGFGERDWGLIQENWGNEPLEEWGLEVWEPEDFSKKNQEIEIDSLDKAMTITLKYSEADYKKVKDALSKVNDSAEKAVYSLLKIK